ncbi:hypothetical protein DL240_17360 [Lujinxingia litoralis]|uniref:DNA mismatch repair proteins mutS family domain-containing protein n=1 Tax=Lujinxingia litoralis TaxID=2211119 RepID=A0A328C5R2_9DELT|nr:hypothetical protein [Lujinxingia litoralis]RAL20350.1 hypothetical protein DL240_17360 [Lujinxingia litoralis]
MRRWSEQAAGGHGEEPGGEAPFADPVTLEVIGARAFVARLAPYSASARAGSSRVRSYAPEELEAWRAEIEALRALDRWYHDCPQAQRPSADALRELPTLERALRRLELHEVLRDAELFEIKRFFFYGLALLEAVEGADGLPLSDDPDAEALRQAMAGMHPEARPTARFHLSDQLDPELAAARKAQRQAARELRGRREALEAEICDSYGGRFDLRGRYRPEAGTTPDDPRLEWRAGAWHLIAPPVADAAQALDRAEVLVAECEQALRKRLSERLAPLAPRIQALHQALVRFDERLARVRLKAELGACWPTLAPESAGASSPAVMHLAHGRDPGLVDRLADQVQPIDVTLEEALTVVLGPNMGGKSALLKLVGLCHFCAQAALPVPAHSFVFSPFHALIYVGSEEPGGASDSEGLSSFGREVRRLVKHWEGRSPRLWLLDELGRGTHPQEGAKFARAVMEARAAAGDRLVVATHFPELAALQGVARLRIRGLEVSDEALRSALAGVDEGELDRLTAGLRGLMDYRPRASQATDVPRDAWRVARALGLELGEFK